MSWFKNISIKIKGVKLAFKNYLAQRKIKNFYSHDEKLLSKVKNTGFLPSWRQLNFVGQYLSKKEKLIIKISGLVIFLALAGLAVNSYISYSKVSPANGGKYIEGLIGAPQYVNPLFAQANDVDMDLSSLIYSGLFKYVNQNLAPDLAESYSISDDQKEYTVKLKNNVNWHDGEKFTADDVIFTFSRINNLDSKTPLYFNFRGSTISKIDDYTIKFSLTEPFAPFLSNLTSGILPMHIWEKIPLENMLLTDYNLKPIGTGPFKFKSLIKNKNGSLKQYNIERNNNYYQKAPYIDEIGFAFFENFDSAIAALNNKNVEGLSYLPKENRNKIINSREIDFHLMQLPQYTALFFNYENNSILKDLKVRQALAMATNKEKIINEILNAEAQIINSPILPGSLGYVQANDEYNSEKAKSNLETDGWKLAEYVVKAPEPVVVKDEAKTETKTETTPAAVETAPNETTPEENIEPIPEKYPYQVRKSKDKYLELTLTTVTQNSRIATEIQQEWQQIGVKINLNIVDQDKIKELIKNRSYEILLYGQNIGNDPDPYFFWHSSMTTAPGLNLTSFKDKKADTLIEEARKTNKDEERATKYAEFQKILAENVPAVFLFNPTYTYPQNKKIQGFNITQIHTPANRFNQISDWYIKTKRHF